jgi:hypothetical protein
MVRPRLLRRDRGGGFDPPRSPATGRGIAESIRGRMERVGGLFRAGVRSELGKTVEIVGEAGSVLEATSRSSTC